MAQRFRMAVAVTAYDKSYGAVSYGLHTAAFRVIETQLFLVPVTETGQPPEDVEAKLVEIGAEATSVHDWMLRMEAEGFTKIDLTEGGEKHGSQDSSGD